LKADADAVPTDRLRLAALLVGLSQVADAGMGLEPGEAARTCLLAVRLGELVGAPDLSAVYYTALLQHLGCTAYAHEAAGALGGDEIAVKSAALRTDFARPGDVVRTYLPALAPEAPPATRLRVAGTAMRRARSITAGYQRANCEVAMLAARRIGLEEAVEEGLGAIFEHPDGRGGPRGLRGDDVPLPARVTQVAAVASLFDGLGGPELAVATVRARAGGSLDAVVADVLVHNAGDLLGELASVDVPRAVLDAEPPPVAGARGVRLDTVCAAFGDLVDLKSPFFHGHAAGTARLAEAAARCLGLPAGEAIALRRAGLLHDLGRIAIPNGIWERPGPLRSGDWERVRLHAYHGERIVAACAPLAPLATAVGMHHERLDGSGYHRGAARAAIPVGARVLACADAFCAMTQPRAHRDALPADAAARALLAERDAGRLDPDAVAAVLDAAGSRVASAPAERPAGLTERQVEVLRLVAAGLSNPEIARRLVVSRRTAERHVQDIYARIGVSSRAAAALFAMEHDLLRGSQDW
jgi:HD-GYP domain-containing protein (c-di-GMP phosphodiesterase class II)